MAEAISVVKFSRMRTSFCIKCIKSSFLNIISVIGYEGKEYPIKAGENFHFAKGGMHSVKANGKFKMALLLTLE